MKEVLGTNMSISPYCIKTSSGFFTKFGQYLTDGECLLFPSKDQRDWQEYIDSQKKSLFITEDCVNVFDNTPVYTVTKNSLYISGPYYNSKGAASGVLWYFSTEESAKKFVDQEKIKRLIEEANERYPIGTRVKSAYRPEFEYTVECGSFYLLNLSSIPRITCGDPNGFSVYYDGKWAEIVSSLYIQESNDTPAPFTKEQVEWIENKIKEVCAKKQ